MPAPTDTTRGGLALMFPGQGAQHPRMAAGLYGVDEAFTTWMDAAFQLLDDGPRLRAAWLAKNPGAELDDVSVAQPLLYAVNHALGRMVLAWGVEVDALVGHSVGELAAATLAGVLRFEDGVALMRHRVAAFAQAPAGGMLAVAAAVEDLAFLGPGVHLAAVNGRRQVVLGGSTEALQDAARELGARGVVCRPVMARQPFHTPLVNDAVRTTLPAFEAVRWTPPTTPLFSCHTSRALTDREATDPLFWAWQAALTVYFSSAFAAMVTTYRPSVVLEVGPGQGLSSLAQRHREVRERGTGVVPLLPTRSRGDGADVDAVREARHEVETRSRPGRFVVVGGHHG